MLKPRSRITSRNSKNGLLAGIGMITVAVGIIVLALALCVFSIGFAIYSGMRCYEALGEGDFLWAAIWAAWPLFGVAGFLRQIFGRESGYP